MKNHLEVLSCPICREPLVLNAGALRCINRHSYDIAAEGYVNLLLIGRKDPGDNADMVAARRAFLLKGYYGKLSSALSSLVLRLAGQT